MRYPSLFKNSDINIFDTVSYSSTDSDQSQGGNSSAYDFVTFDNWSFDDTWSSYLSHPLGSSYLSHPLGSSYLSHPLENAESDWNSHLFKLRRSKRMIGIAQLQRLNDILEPYRSNKQEVEPYRSNKQVGFNLRSRNVRNRIHTIDYSDLKEDRTDLRYFMTEKSLKLSEEKDLRKVREFLFPGRKSKIPAVGAEMILML